MTLSFKQLANELLFIPLGGAGEIGMNLALYHYKGKWLIVDVGIGFADQHFPGIDIMVPNINFINKHIKKTDIVGIVLTHAHEDHIGGLQYLWYELKAPVYTTTFTATVLKAKFAEFGLKEKDFITEVAPNTLIDLGPFSINMVGITHSIPDNHGVLIKTEKGNIFHTGDWKLDDKPVVGEVTNEKLLRQIGDEGVLAMIGDSTNIFNPGKTGSEGDLQESLEELIGQAREGMIVVTTFASNIARLYSIAQAAKKAKRKVILAGRSLWRMYRAALSAGYLEDMDEFLPDTEAIRFKRHEILVICTGCQGEPLAATSKMAYGHHQNLKLVPNDTIIFSSKIIPGNEKKIYGLLNQFCLMGVEVLTENDHFVHVSGHPSQQDVAQMYDLLRPTIAIPVHGEAIHIHMHAKFAKEQGCKHVIEVKNGDVVLLNKTKSNKIAQVEAGYTLIDGTYLLDENSPVLRARRRMRDNGLLSVTCIVHKKMLAEDVIIHAPGILDDNEDSEIIDEMKAMVSEIVDKSHNKPTDVLKQSLNAMLKKFIKHEVGKRPEVILHVHRI